MADTDTDTDTARPEDSIPPSERRWYLNDEREFLLRSLGDADRELEAGDLSAEDHAVLTERDRLRLAEVDAALAALGDADEDPPLAAAPPEVVAARRSDWRRVGIVACVFLIVAGVVILVDHALRPRQPGQASSGSITLSKAQQVEEQLAQARADDNGGQVLQAIKLYDQVLREDPQDPVALAESGWLDWNYGTEGASPTLTVEGRHKEEEAIRLDPTFWEGHLFYGLILYNQDADAKAAVVQFDEFLADGPPAAEVKDAAALIRGAYTAAGQTVPSELGAAGG